MQRRQVLKGGSTLLVTPLAGCGHPPVVLDMEETTATDITNEVSSTVEPGSEEYELLVEARDNGSVTRNGRTELFDRTDTVRLGSSFYDVSETRLSNSEVTVYEVLIDFNPANSTAELGEIEYEDLPAADRQRLEPIVSGGDPPSQDGFDMGIAYGSVEEVGNDSVFVPERQYDIIIHDGNRYRVAVNSRTASEGEYRYEVTEIAAGVDAFADQIRDQYLFTLTNLSDAEREVVEQAIDEGYFRDNEAFRSVVDRIRQHEGLSVEDFYGTWLLEFERVEYLTYAQW